MPRVKKQRKPRPLLRSAPPHPPELKGREIGLYYRSLQVKKNNAEEKSWIHLRIPHNVIVGIYNCLQKIDKIARVKNIYLVPVKKLNFYATPRNADFIPIKATNSDKVTHSINNIHKRDDDVLFVNNKEPEAIEISDSGSESIVDITENIDTPENKPKTTSVSDNDVVFISNNYTSGPSTSAAHSTFSHNNKTSASGDYKYGYDDIITGTFQGKLEECLSKGIKITMKTPEVDELNDTLKEEHLQKRTKNDQYKKMMEFRETLPTYKKAKEVLDIINKNQVIVISGETGCGKSTQIPQLILDEAVVNGKGANIKILVTEPRRIAASSLAFRVAEERGERPGTSVGYAVRLEATQCRERGSIMFCTTGVLLVELEQNQALTSYSHIILDEVHERDCQIDLTMCMLREVLKKRKDLKLILMSATIDADSLSNYYDKCPMIHIEGLAYPVKAVFMEEILAATKFQLPKMPELLRNPKHWHKFIKKNRGPLAGAEKNLQYRATMGPWLSTIKKDLDPIVFQQLQDFRIEEINFQLIIELLKYISQKQPGAILVFLPGYNDISKLMTLMHQSEAFPSFSHEIHPLHSKLSTAVQNKIFKRPPGNIRKIVLATNVAETSITIDDVVYVVDCGKMKHKGLNVERNLSTLQVEWISKANMRQRRGRAGRCQPGICYHLITSYRAENLADRLPPELQRSNLLEEVLCIKKLRLGRAEDALNMMPAVPAEKTVQAAIKHLQQIGALDERETLTPLGWHVARLPVHPAAGKLLLLGALFGCLDRAASVAAVWGFKEPFQLVIGKEKLVNQAKRDFALGEPSDHIAISEALIQWEQLICPIKKRQFAYETFLSHNTMRLLSDMKRQFADHLKQMGFLRKADVHSKWENRNMDNMSLFKALIAASLYPNIATVKWSNLHHRNPHKPMSIKAFTPEDGKVELHPSSVMYTKVYRRESQPICTNAGANWLVYWLKQKSTQLYLLDVTCVYTLPLMFFGDLNFAEAESADECFISISTQKVCCKKETADLLFRLRSLLDQVLTSKITHSSDYQSRRNFEFDEEVLNAVKDLITAEDEGTQYVGDDDDEDDYNCGAAPSNGSLRWGN